MNAADAAQLLNRARAAVDRSTMPDERAAALAAMFDDAARTPQLAAPGVIKLAWVVVNADTAARRV